LKAATNDATRPASAVVGRIGHEDRPRGIFRREIIRPQFSRTQSLSQASPVAKVTHPFAFAFAKPGAA